MASPSYIPAPDAGFESWLLNFTSELTATPTVYGLVAGDAVICAAEYTAWNAAYLTATTPATRTKPAIAAKDAARAHAESVVRPYAQRIKVNPAVTNLSRAAIGVTINAFPPTPIPAPITSPALMLVGAQPNNATLQYRDSATPTSKAKPYGVKQCSICTTIGIAPAVDPDAARYVGGFTKSPVQLGFDSADRGKYCTVFARWENGSGPGGVGAFGPWGAPISFIIL